MSAANVSQEHRFTFLLHDALLVGVLDVLAYEGQHALVVDYKTNRLLGRDPTDIVESEYALQRLAYALALLRAGAPEVEVAYCFLEKPEQTVAQTFTATHAAQLEGELEPIEERAA